MMESPLDVLSMAASMVEKTAAENEVLLRSSSPSRLDRRSSPGKELPSKLITRNRRQDRQEVAAILDADRERTERLTTIKKTASTQTQTQFSSFPHESAVVPVPPPPYFANHDTIDAPHRRDGAPLSGTIPPPHHTYSTHHHNVQRLPPPPPHPHSTPLPPHASLSSSSSSSSLSFLPNSQSSPAYSSTANGNPPPKSSSFGPSQIVHNVSTSTSSSISANGSSTPPVPSHHKHPTSLPPPSYYTAANGTPPPKYAPLSRQPSSAANNVQDSPLNLSIATEGILVTASLPRNTPATAINHKKAWIHQSEKGNSQEIIQEDESIEEHFRRSLGQKYSVSSSSSTKSKTTSLLTTSGSSSYSLSTSSSPPSMTAASQKTTTTTTLQSQGPETAASVDDHFARALGDQMWTAIKAKSDPPTPDPFPDTVDAHFAKALGASMWRKIQAKVD